MTIEIIDKLEARRHELEKKWQHHHIIAFIDSDGRGFSIDIIDKITNVLLEEEWWWIDDTKWHWIDDDKWKCDVFVHDIDGKLKLDKTKTLLLNKHKLKTNAELNLVSIAIPRYLYNQLKDYVKEYAAGLTVSSVLKEVIENFIVQNKKKKKDN